MVLWKQPITLSNSMRATFYLIDLVSQCTAVRACRQEFSAKVIFGNSSSDDDVDQ